MRRGLTPVAAAGAGRRCRASRWPSELCSDVPAARIGRRREKPRRRSNVSLKRHSTWRMSMGSATGVLHHLPGGGSRGLHGEAEAWSADAYLYLLRVLTIGPL